MNEYNYDLEEGMFNYEAFERFLLWATLDVKANDIFIETNEPLGIKKDNVTYNVTDIEVSYDEISAIINDTRFYETSASAALMTGRKVLDFAYSMSYGEDKVLRFRVNATPCNSTDSPIKGIDISLRPTAGIPPTIADLKLPSRYVETCNFKEGMVLVTGPTGSGKTTMLAALIGHIVKTQRRRIITAEDPIEYDFKLINNRLSRINQCEIMTNIESFSLFSSNSLRRSPDVVFMGELRDKKSIDGGVRISQTGHLVYATGHSNDAATALERFADEYDYNEKRGKLMRLISNTKALIHQRLLAKRGGGRIAVHEDIFLSNKIKMALYSRLNSGGDGISDLLQEFVFQEGTPLITSVKKAYSDGHLTLSNAIDQIVEKITINDIDWFRNETTSLYNNNIITELEHDEWVAEILSYKEYMEH